MSSSATRPYLAVILDYLHVQLSDEYFDLLHTVTRKSAHVLEYAVFALLLYRSAARGTSQGWQPYAARLAILGACLYSLSDELHQLFVVDRGPSLWDCCLDATGATLAIAIVYVATRRHREPLADV